LIKVHYVFINNIVLMTRSIKRI